MAIDDDKLQAFLGAAVTDFGAAFSTALVYVGDRLGLYRELAAAGPLTAAELATRTGCVQRLVQEWLFNQVAGGYVEHDPSSSTYSLTEEQALALAQPDSPVALAGIADIAVSVYADADKLIAAYRGERELEWSGHDERLFTGTDRFFRPGYAANLVASWLPALDGVVAGLESGIRVADLGCGHGASTVLMAQAYPASTFVGSDYHRESIEAARKAAADAGVADRVSFEVSTAQQVTGGPYDLACLFDCLHDMGDPVGALRSIAANLAPGGTLLLVEPNAADDLAGNTNPVGRFFYAASAAICIPNAVAHGAGDAALGAQAGEARTRAVFDEAGWSHVRRATETPFNVVYEARP